MFSKEVDSDKKSDFQGQNHRHSEIKKNIFERIFKKILKHIKVTSVLISNNIVIN